VGTGYVGTVFLMGGILATEKIVVGSGTVGTVIFVIRMHTLTRIFAIPDGTDVTLVDPPVWVKSVEVVNDNLVMTVKPEGFQIIFQFDTGVETFS
jgi:hypothetical protein